MHRLRAGLIMLCGVGTLALSAQAAVRHIPETGNEARLPFAAATAAGDFIYVTGTGGAGSDIGAQTGSALDRIAAILKKAGASLGDVVQTRVYLTDPANAEGMEQAYGARFGNNAPARSVIVTPALIGGRGLIEIDAIAVRHGVAHRAILPRGWQKPPGPFSYAEKVGNTLFISGLTARNPADGSGPPNNIGAQTQAIMDDIGAVLKAAGMGYDDIAAGRVWLSDITKNYRDMNAVYRTYFIGALPARATLQLGLVNPADLVEISAVAVKGGRRHAIAAAIRDDGSAGKPNPNFSAGMAIGNRMWITGMTGQTADNKDDVSSQAREALTRMLRVLKAGGFNPNQVVDVNIYLRDARDIKQYQQLNAGYREVFQKDLPARTTVQALNAGKTLVEITLMAAR
jgi:2-iminobutanoate/2-iminopropanoate deaminase